MIGTQQPRGSGEAARTAHKLFVKATELDRDYGAAYGLAAFSAGRMKSSGLLNASAPEVAEGVRLAWLAAQIGRDYPTALSYAALPLSVLGLNPEAGARLSDRACVPQSKLRDGVVRFGTNAEFSRRNDDGYRALRVRDTPQSGRSIASPVPGWHVGSTQHGGPP